MTLPPNNTEPDSPPAIPMATLAPSMPPQMEYATLDQAYYPRTRGWLITAGILWIMLSIPAFLFSAALSLNFCIAFTSRTKSVNEQSELAAWAILSICTTVLLLKLAVGTFRMHRWVAKWGAITSLFMLMISFLFNPIYVATTLSGLQTFDSLTIAITALLMGIPLAISSLLTFIYLRPDSARHINTRRPATSWTDRFSVGRLFLLTVPAMSVIMAPYNLWTLSGINSRSGVMSSSFILEGISVLLAIALIFLTAKNNPRSWALALIFYGLCFFRFDFSSVLIYYVVWFSQFGFSPRFNSIGPASPSASAIVLYLLLPLLHAWFGHDNLQPTGSGFPVIPPACDKSIAASSPAQPVAPMALFNAAPTDPNAVPMATLMTAPAQADARTISYESLQPRADRRTQKILRYGAILWLCLAFLQSWKAYAVLDAQQMSNMLGTRQSMVPRGGGNFLTAFINLGGISPLLIFDLVLMLGFAAVGIGLLRKNRWTEAVASAILLPVLLIAIVLPATTIVQVNQDYRGYANLSAFYVTLFVDLLRLLAVVALMRMHKNPAIPSLLKQHDSDPSALDAISPLRLQLIALFLIAAIFEGITAVGMDTYLPTRGIHASLQKGLPSILVATGWLVAAYLAIKNKDHWPIIGGMSCLLFLVNLSMTRFQWFSIAPDLGLPLCQAAFCCLILFHLFRQASASTTLKANNIT